MNRQERRQQKRQEEVILCQPAIQEKVVEVMQATSSTEQDVPQHLQCPICFHGENRGVGKQYSAYPLKKTKYFRCEKCGHTWSAVIKTVVTQINHRVPEDLSER